MHTEYGYIKINVRECRRGNQKWTIRDTLNVGHRTEEEVKQNKNTTQSNNLAILIE
jgi:hypothetical protein